MVREQMPDSASQKLVNGYISTYSDSNWHVSSQSSAHELQLVSDVPDSMVIPRC